MNKYIKIGFQVFPWIGMFVLGYLWLGTFANLAAADHYSAQTFRDMKSQQEQLTSYIKSRRNYENDQVAFQKLDLISSDQYDGKYEPWLHTEMGFIKFDANGFIVAVCPVSSGLNHPECPPQL